ncbi:TetR/AcrR family transcriptional regulator, partial [Burkholderia multivorans]
PYGLVRPFIGTEVPPWVDDAVAASAGAIVALGDGPDGS